MCVATSSSAPRSISVTINEPFSVSFQRSATGVVVEFNVHGGPQKNSGCLSYFDSPRSRHGELRLPPPGSVEGKFDAGFEAQAKMAGAMMAQGAESYAKTMQMFQNFSFTPRPSSSCPRIANAAHSESLATMLCSVVWFDWAKGYGFASPVQPGHCDVIIYNQELRAAGIDDLEKGTLLKLTFDPSEYTARRRPRALLVQWP